MTTKIINVAMFALMIFVNYLANSLPINGRTTGQVSGDYDNLFTPAGITFSIWGIIYILILLFVILQFWDSNREVASKISYAFWISCALNALWIFAWHYDKLLVSFIIMIGLLVSLIVINMRIANSPSGLVKATFGIYLGWICIATIANATVLLVSYNWNGWGISHQVWAIAVIIIGALIVSFSVVSFKNYFIAIVAIWAFLGILLKQYNQNPAVVIGAIFGIVNVLVVTLRFLFVNRLKY